MKVPAFLLAAVIGAPPPPGPDGSFAPPPGSAFVSPARGAAGERGMSGPVTCEDDRGWSGGRWHGLRVLATDGTHFALRGKAGTSASWQHFGSAAGSRPLAQMVAVTEAWTRADVAVAVGKDCASEAELSAHLLPAFGPGTVGLADRGFPSHQAALDMRDAGADFVWRTSSSWKLARCGKPLADGTYLTRLTSRGRTMKARVVEFRIDFLTQLPAGHPLLTDRDADATVTVTDGAAAGLPDVAGLVTVQVSQTFTLITSLLGIKAYPAADIAALYGDRWTVELVFFDLKVTVLSARHPVPVTAPRRHLPRDPVRRRRAARAAAARTPLRRHRRPGRPRRPAQLRRAARRNHHLHHRRARIDRAAARRPGRPAHRHHPASQPLDRAAPARPPLPPLHHQKATVPQTRREHRRRPDPPPPAAPRRRRPRRRPRAQPNPPR